MPELPEVETVVRSLREPLVGRTIQSLWVDGKTAIDPASPDEFAARIVGQTFKAVRRRAKYIVAELDHDLLVVHLKMTGRLYVVPQTLDDGDDRWIHVRFRLDNGSELRFSDARRFGRVYLTNDFGAISDGAAGLGPEPLDDEFTLDMFQERLQGRNRAIKGLLLDQSFIAGVGNIYADEALIRAKIHPLRRADGLTTDESARLYATVRAALSEGIHHEGASVNWYRKPDGERGEAQDYLYAYGRTGEPCRTCGTPIEKLRVAQRGTHICPNCQRLDDE
ncbi:MAG TPA: bifunctional DNA-formamidopyrimidine glycosylase/DNA-(apurinic or apyrimidinic site) lyase [Phototrophicaceae bacterium]|nr:bifunctional DNA-formamidopyrimidine glycosylase/DNA-(apurinic or apyrimidinic site) lyase [Phototrophicaceae bacterium]